ncbi:MAG TPA: TonB-dependent receptor [Rhodanobacteraceae bacterium]
MKRFRSKVMFTIVGGVVIINPLYAQNTQPAPQTTPVAQTTSQSASKNGKKASASKSAGQQQSPTQLQGIVVTGMRSSLEQSMDIKRNAIGVVDAISAEDIGKFPDTNLADSLQRVTGVSINRRNGSGSQVTVRGFGPGYNMVTVDGRIIPGADAFGAAGQVPIGDINGGTRAFNFAQLSPDGVNALEVYKTGRANEASGGIGATIDIKTDKPFYHKGGKVIAAFGVKALDDTGEPFGNSVTPEYSGTFSYANPDKTWGIGINGSYQKRHGGNVQATENAWTTKVWTGSDPAFRPDAVITNAPKIGQLYAIPNDIRYAFYDFRTTRKNAHMVFQLKPIDSLTMTMDYLYSRYQITADRGEQSMWLQQANSFTAATFDTDQAVATPVYLRDVPDGEKDFGMEQQHYMQNYKLDSLGLNAKWDVTDDFSLTFDGHDAKSQSVPDDPLTGGGATFISIAGTNPPNCTGVQCGGAWGQEFRFNGGLPIATRTWYPSHADAIDSAGDGVVNMPFAAKNIGTQPLRIDAQAQTTEVKEARIDGEWDFSNGRFQFGTDFIKTTLHQTQAVENSFNLGNWSVSDAGEYPDLMNYLHQVDTVGLFHSYNTGGIATSTWRGNADSLAQWAAKHYPDVKLTVNPTLAADNRVEEYTKAAYMQVVFNSELGSLPTTTRFGMRYEQTNVTSSSLVAIPSAIVWESNNDFKTDVSATNKKTFGQTASYSNLLPNIDFDINFTDSLVGRAAYSKTIARAPYGNLYASQSSGNPTGSVLIDPGAQATGSIENPALKPLTSDNLDLGLGWYFAPASYVSVTFWDKRVKNFIGNSVLQENLFGLRDPTSGPRAKQAAAFLQSAQCKAQVTAAGGDATSSCALNNTSLYTTVALLTNAAATGGLAAYNGSSAQVFAMENNYDVTADPDDPLYTFAVSKPVNQHQAMIHGWEFGGQYFFGHTGFGVLANYTLVDGDVHFNNSGDPTVSQFALTGLSNTANVVLMYEKYGWSARLAWNWRGENLLLTNQGNTNNPYYVDPYQEYDLSVSYDVNDHLSFTFDGINLAGEPIRWRARSEMQFVRVVDQKPFYELGVHYKF